MQPKYGHQEGAALGYSQGAQLPAAVGRGGPHANMPGLQVPGRRHGGGHGLGGVGGRCASLPRGVQGVAQPGRSRLGPRCVEELDRRGCRAAQVHPQVKVNHTCARRAQLGSGGIIDGSATLQTC